jgi:hypothetical protein
LTPAEVSRRHRQFLRADSVPLPSTAELLVVARSQEESIVSRFEADVLTVIADTLTQASALMEASASSQHAIVPFS